MGKLPADMAWIMRKMRAISEADKAIVESVISEFFTRKGGKIFNDRLLKEWVKANVSHDKRISAGSKGGKAKSLKINDTNASNATAMQQHTRAFPEPEPEPEPDKKKEYAQAPINVPEKPPPKARLPENWTLSESGWAYARSKQIPDEAIEDEARGFHAYWTDRRDRDAAKSARGWEQCWAERCRTIAGRYQSRSGMAGSSKANGYGQRSSLASIAARRRTEGQV